MYLTKDQAEKIVLHNIAMLRAQGVPDPQIAVSLRLKPAQARELGLKGAHNTAPEDCPFLAFTKAPEGLAWVKFDAYHNRILAKGFCSEAKAPSIIAQHGADAEVVTDALYNGFKSQKIVSLDRAHAVILKGVEGGTCKAIRNMIGSHRTGGVRQQQWFCLLMCLFLQFQAEQKEVR